MKQVGLILVTIFVLSSGVQAENSITLSYSPNSISRAMDLAVSGSYLDYLYAQESGQMNSEYKGYKQADSLKLKNPNTALFYAAVPGFIVHGAGHFYAGKSETGIILFTTGVIGGVMIASGAINTGWAEGWSTTESSERKGQALLITGGVLFLGSWLYDMIGAPLSISNKNEKILEKQRGLKFSII